MEQQAIIESSETGAAVVTGTNVGCVVLDGRRAIGVRTLDGVDLPADHVVMAAGAIHTPAILLRSGVETPGIGDRLQDHPAAPLALELRAGVDRNPNGLVVASVLEVDGTQILPMNHLGNNSGASGLGMLMPAVLRPAGHTGAAA